ncbi:hypothetical protein HPGCJGGD_1904 [Methylobacterium haplocladii]|nr:hypothetical protein HPGCJGGD_1904 [Methylobacterium haplocladii]
MTHNGRMWWSPLLDDRRGAGSHATLPHTLAMKPARTMLILASTARIGDPQLQP